MERTRRRFLGDVLRGGLERVLEASQAVGSRSPEDVAQDEFYWREIQSAFTLDRTIINLNNGGVCPSPRVVHEAFKRYLDITNQSPVYHMWQILEPNVESVRRQLAADFGCDPEELAITRNASEALQTAQLGLDLKPGDEVLTTDQDYPRMQTTWEQRIRRDGITLKKVSFPVPPPGQQYLLEMFENAITPRTKVLLFCQITNLTGQIFPTREICRMARSRGVRTIVDGAHAFAHFPFVGRDLECDYYGTSLHKWLTAPVGTGFLYVRREHIAGLWPLQPGRQHPEVRGDRHAPCGQSQRHRRGARVPARHRHRAEGCAAPVPEEPLGAAPREDPRRAHPHALRSRAVVRTCQCGARRGGLLETGRASLEHGPHHRGAHQAG
jgi:selenocysteine lyase/cysteine desulfurase